MKIVGGSIIALFAFDVGYEIALESLDAIVAAHRAQQLSGKKRTPPHLQYAHPPRVLLLPLGPVLFGVAAQVQATIFDFGAVSISYRWPIAPAGEGLPFRELPERAMLVAAANLEVDARRRIVTVMNDIGFAVSRPEISPLVEDYYLLVIERLDRVLRGDELLMQEASTLARALRFESAALSREHVEEAIAQRISYYECDLVVIDWNAAMIYDVDYEDAASVLELMNVELLEARHIDAQLDSRIEGFDRLMQEPSRLPLPLRMPYTTTLQELAELRIEVSILSERVDNALKLIGDLYLAKVHDAAAERFYLPEWERTIAEKLRVVGDFYGVLVDRARTAQSQALELIVIILIFVELIVAVISIGR